ncbi:MAG: HNH endonuclease [Bacteroidota bacterium]
MDKREFIQLMKVHEKYTEALKTFSEYVTVHEWAQRVCELYPDLLKKAEKEARAQKQETTGLREIAARISSRLSSGNFKNVEIDVNERPRKVKFTSVQEQQSNQAKELVEDFEPINRIEIINHAKDKLKIYELYRLDEFKNIQKAFNEFFGIDFERDHAQALLNKEDRGDHHPDNIQLLLKYHNTKKSNNSWDRFSFEEQKKYILDTIKLQTNVAGKFDIELNNDILTHLLNRLKMIYE